MSYRIRDQVIAIAGRLCKYATIARSTAKGFDFITKPEAGPDEPENQEQARRLQDFGLRSVPLPGSECAVIASRGGSSNKIIVATDNLNYGPTDLKSGESCVYNSKDKDGTLCRIKLDENADVTVNGGTAKVGRVGDKVSVKIYFTTATIMGIPVITGISGVGPLPNTETLNGQIDAGADHFKA